MITLKNMHLLVLKTRKLNGEYWNNDTMICVMSRTRGVTYSYASMYGVFPPNDEEPFEKPFEKLQPTCLSNKN